MIFHEIARKSRTFSLNRIKTNIWRRLVTALWLNCWRKKNTVNIVPWYRIAIFLEITHNFLTWARWGEKTWCWSTQKRLHKWCYSTVRCKVSILQLWWWAEKGRGKCSIEHVGCSWSFSAEADIETYSILMFANFQWAILLHLLLKERSLNASYILMQASTGNSHLNIGFYGLWMNMHSIAGTNRFRQLARSFHLRKILRKIQNWLNKREELPILKFPELISWWDLSLMIFYQANLEFLKSHSIFLMWEDLALMHFYHRSNQRMCMRLAIDDIFFIAAIG